jgi:ParB/RepB/Spo0J family partition protein
MASTAAATATPAPVAPEPQFTLPLAELGPATFKQQRYIPLELIHPSPFNPRKEFDDAGIAELAESIKVNGLQQNLVVRPHPKKREHYELMGGERRLRALKLLKAEGAVCQVKEADDADSIALQLIENLQREDVEPMAEARAFADLQKLDPVKYSPARVAAQIGKSKRFVLQRISLVNNLSDDLQEAMKGRDGMKIETARTIAALPHSLQKAVLDRHRWRLSHLSADEARKTVADAAVPVSAAAFDVALYQGEIIEEGSKRYFADVAQFDRLQKVAAKARLEQLQKKWPGAKLVNESALASWQWGDNGNQVRWSPDHKVTGKVPKTCTAIVYIDDKHRIRTAEGVKPWKRPSYSYSSAPSYQETPERKIVRETFNAQLVEAFAKDSGVALRFMMLDLITGDSGLNVSAAILKRALPTITVKAGWMRDEEKAKVWPKFAALKDAAVITALREIARAQLDDNYEHVWSYHEKTCPRLLLALGATLGVKPQAEKPIVPAEPQKAAPKAKAKAKAKAKGKKKQ